jgi:hypothetical protein
MVRVDVQVALGVDVQIDQAVAGDLVQHVIQEGHWCIETAHAAAIEIEAHDRRASRVGLDADIAGRTLSEIQLAVGTDAHNLVRFEPNLNGVFLRVEAAVIDPAAGSAGRFDLNPHLDYATRTVAPDQRALGLGDPRGVVVSGDGTRVFVTGMGSSNVAAVSIPDGARLALGQTGEGPTGIALDEVDGGRIFTLNRFDGSISVLDAGSLATLATAKYFDPTPQALRDGRPFLYDTHLSSGLGQASCASCHIDARMTSSHGTSEIRRG